MGDVPGNPLLLDPGEDMPTRFEARTVSDCRYPEIALAALDDAEVGSHFHKAPIQPLDLAVLLDSARKAGYSRLAITSPLMWEQACDPLVTQTLLRKLQEFPTALLGLRGRTASRPEFTPVELTGSAIPASRIEGSIALLPSANAALPRSLSGDTFGPWALDWIENEPLMAPENREGSSYPLLARWHGDIYPTLPLRLVMLAEGIAPEELRVEIGSRIAWRKTELPLDSYGRTTLSGGEKARRVPLADIMEKVEREHAADAAGSYLLLSEPVASQPGDRARAEWMAATLSRLACRTTERTEWISKTAEGFALRRARESAADYLIALVVAGAFLLAAPRLSGAGHFVAEMLVLVAGALALSRLMEQGLWVPAAPWLAALLVVLLGGRLLRLGYRRRR